MKSWRSLIGWPQSIRRCPASESTSSRTPPETSARPLRLRLLFWIAIWLAPVAAISIVQGIDRVERDAADVRERMFESGRANASQEENVFASGEQVLRALANQPQVREPGAGCAKALADGLKGLVYFADFYRVDPHGNILCAAVMPVGSSSFANQLWWQQAILAKAFFIAPEIYSPTLQRDILRGVLPLHNSNGEFDGAIVLAFDVSWLDRLLRSRPPPADTVLAVFDAAGAIVAANDEREAQAIFNHHPPVGQQEQLLSTDALGHSWTYALVPISSRGIAVGFARRNSVLFGGTYVHVATNLLLPVFMLALASAAIWIATGRLITHWLQYLRRIALAYTHGHYGVRPIALAAAPSEFRELGETISTMAAAVEDRDRRLRNALEQKSLLIRETHHRVKNNLQIVMSLLSLQAGKLRDPAAQQALRQAQFRVNALALVHRILYENDDLAEIALKKLIEDVAKQIQDADGSQSRDLRLEFNLAQRNVTSDLAVQLTLFLVEALTNAFRHAYPDEARGTIFISLLPAPGGMLRLTVEDDGIGFGPPEEGAGIGSRLIEAFARQAGGTASVRHRKPSGTVVELLFPDPESESPRSDDPDEFRGPETVNIDGAAANPSRAVSQIG
jgi:two-component sensor histidine kinase